ncbi:MAG: S-methyl-5-thioribose-1-phosphate isomerase [Polyangiaceae bacterium]
MRIHGVHRRSILPDPNRAWIEVIDQRALPHALVLTKLATLPEVAVAIRAMWVRGAPLIGAVAAYGFCFALAADPSDAGIEHACRELLSTRPTAVNLRWALDEMRRALRGTPPAGRFDAAWARAQAICEEDVAINAAIGGHGLNLLRDLWVRRRSPLCLNVLTHCNAGWLATLDWGTALAPIYMAHDSGIPVHVWVSETRPRVQGGLTSWELGQHGVPHTVVVDNAAGHLMQHDMVDVCIVGADRVTARGDACNKIGTYLKAVAAKDTGVPFYVALPYPTIDWTLDDGLQSIPIEQRDAAEVQRLPGAGAQPLYPEGAAVANYGFDVTPARLITGLITERGLTRATREGLLSLYPEKSDTSS